MAEGLAAAHEPGLVHRDIKPGNVWLEGPPAAGQDPRLRAAPGRPTAADPSGGGEPLTAAGAVVGTPAYMSPEQARGAAVDARTDLFSLGVVLYQMATGRLPFTGDSTTAVLIAVAVDDPPARGRELVPDLPAGPAALIVRLLAKDPPAGRPDGRGGGGRAGADRSRRWRPRVRVIPLDVGPRGAGPGEPVGGTGERPRGRPSRPLRRGAGRGRGGGRPPPGSRKAWVWGGRRSRWWPARCALGVGLLAGPVGRCWPRGGSSWSRPTTRTWRS